MADYNLTSLARALSQPQLELQAEGTNEIASPRSLPVQPPRLTRLSSCTSLEFFDTATSPCAREAHVLVVNTGGTIGMMRRDGI